MPYKDPAKQRAYSKQHYKKYKQKYLQSNYRRREELRNYIRCIKADTPCTDCSEQYPHYVMDFDHLRDKEGLIAHFVNYNNKKALDAELKKCEVVCANCHRERSYGRLKFRK